MIVTRTARVVTICEHFTRRHVSGVGASAVMEDVSRGWFLSLSGSYESLWVGDARPEGITVGDCVRVSLERVEEPPPVRVSQEQRS